MSERFNEAVLKTVEGHTSGGSNPSLSAEYFFVIEKLKEPANYIAGFFIAGVPDSSRKTFVDYFYFIEVNFPLFRR